MIYVLFGHPASGKTTLLNKLKSLYPIDINVKATNRLFRDDDDDVLSFESAADFLNDDTYSPFVYSHGYADRKGNKIYYGVNKKQIDDSLRNNRAHWLICSSINMYTAMLDEYFPYILLICLHTDFPKKQIVNSITHRRFSNREDLPKRINGICARKRDYANNYELFDYTLINHYQNTSADIEAEICRLSGRCIDIMKKYGDCIGGKRC